MSDNFVQAVSNNTDPGTTTVTVVVNGVTAGNTLVAWSFNGSSTTNPPTIGDGQNAAWTSRGSDIADPGDNVVGKIFQLDNANGGTHTIVGTVSVAEDLFVLVAEVATTAATPFSGTNGQFQSAPGTSAGAVTTGSIPVSGAATLLSFSTDSASLSAGNEPAAVSGTSRANGTAIAIGAWRLQSQGASAAAAGTFTAVAGGDSYITLGIAILNGGAGPVVNTKNQTDPITVLDQSSKVRRISRALIDAFSVDPDNSTKLNSTFLGETITLTDLVSGQVVKVRLSTDALTTSDKLTDSVYRNRLPLDTTVVTDTLTDFAVRCRALNEQLVMIDTLLKAGGNIVNTKSISEAFLIADILAQRLVLNRTIGETISLTDALLALKSGIQIKLLSEAIAVGDSNAESVYRSRLLIDTAAFVDSLQGAKGKFASFTDNIAVADAVMRLVQNSRAIAESMIINDLFAKVILNTRSLPEFISMFDLQLGVYVPFINVTDIAKVQITLGAQQMVSLGANDFIRLGAA